MASYYGRALEGHLMANGQPFDPDALTAAHKTLPFGTQLEVTYGGRSVRVTITDRGPYVAGRDLDLSLAAARKLGMLSRGVAPVRVRIVVVSAQARFQSHPADVARYRTATLGYETPGLLTASDHKRTC